MDATIEIREKKGRGQKANRAKDVSPKRAATPFCKNTQAHTTCIENDSLQSRHIRFYQVGILSNTPEPFTGTRDSAERLLTTHKRQDQDQDLVADLEQLGRLHTRQTR